MSIDCEDQSYAEDASPTAQSPDYVPDTDPEADPEEDDDEDPEEDPIDYPADGGDDGDDEMDIEEDEDDDMDIDADEEDEDDEMDVEVDEEAEEEHPAPAYPVVVALPATAPSAEETEPFETDESAATPPPHPAYRMTARITIPEPLPVPAMGRLKACCHYGTSIRSDPERYVGYGITDLWDKIVETLQGASVSTDTELGAHMRDFESMVRRDTYEIYTMLDDEQSQRQLLASRVNTLFGDRRGHVHIRLLMETEARISREAWGKSMDGRSNVTVRGRSRRRPISDLLEIDRGRREEMRELRAADRTRQQQIIQTLTVMQTLQREMIPLQGLVTTLQGQGPVGGPAQPELPGEAGKMAPNELPGQHRSQQHSAPTATTTTTVTNATIQALIDKGVCDALGRSCRKQECMIAFFRERGVRGIERVARECTYQDFMKCKPLYFKGTEGVVELTQWFERMETVFRISNCSVENQVKFSTCTLLASALTWWNSHVMTVTHDVAYSMTWVDLRKDR
ncbi:hypothetical protein Tco_0356713 [Tanacetum coccineum]